MDYLLKTEPTVYSFADLEREQTTIWDGVTNPAAVKHLREMKLGERLVIYHTGSGTKKGEKSAVGTASVVAVDASDPRTCLLYTSVLTARDPESNEKRTLEAGAVAFFQKPADNEELLGVIRASLQAGWGWGGRPSS